MKALVVLPACPVTWKELKAAANSPVMALARARAVTIRKRPPTLRAFMRR